ncbi:MAG TPA: PHP domain-containing protein [Thermoplasmatales archaeon]|uniref:Histidinol phosphatase n=1 Tax=Candidatus Syntropharchaeum caldarium TaxID=1838285 RepID=A0A1F2P807_9EURY|nr:MAG: histidinol phosphatase [Candidatus Syntrophoarchaeum caldarius]HEC77316.1 PHP domain-containing protein [Thermoplasmatales archaeon]
MKIWKKYTNYLLKGEWHIHTNYTDGKNSVSEYCKKAIELKIPLVAFTEHVRKNTNHVYYDFNQFLDDIEKAREEFNLIILSGCEAKVLPNGGFDVEEWILKEVDYSIFAFHSFPEDIDMYIESLNSVLRNRYVNAWAHPGAFLTKHGLELSEKELIKIFKSMWKQEVLLEINGKYSVPSENWISVARRYNVRLVRGSDIHCINELKGELNG